MSGTGCGLRGRRAVASRWARRGEGEWRLGRCFGVAGRCGRVGSALDVYVVGGEASELVYLTNDALFIALSKLGGVLTLGYFVLDTMC